MNLRSGHSLQSRWKQRVGEHTRSAAEQTTAGCVFLSRLLEKVLHACSAPEASHCSTMAAPVSGLNLPERDRWLESKGLTSSQKKCERGKGGPATETDGLFFSLAKPSLISSCWQYLVQTARLLIERPAEVFLAQQGYIYISGSGGLVDKIRGFLIQSWTWKTPREILLPLLWFCWMESATEPLFFNLCAEPAGCRTQLPCILAVIIELF